MRSIDRQRCLNVENGTTLDYVPAKYILVNVIALPRARDEARDFLPLGQGFDCTVSPLFSFGA